VIFVLAMFCCCFLTESFFSHRFCVAQSSFFCFPHLILHARCTDHAAGSSDFPVAARWGSRSARQASFLLRVFLSVGFDFRVRKGFPPAGRISPLKSMFLIRSVEFGLCPASALFRSCPGSFCVPLVFPVECQAHHAGGFSSPVRCSRLGFSQR
jgi:hypothetical protein